MSEDSSSIPEGPLDLSWSEIVHPTAFFVLNSFSSNREAVGLKHPEKTITCAEKQALFQRYAYLYSGYGEIRIARATVLLVKTGLDERILLYVGDSEERIVWKELRHWLNLRKRDDVRVYEGDVEKITGLPLGGISPLLKDGHQVSQILFARNLQTKEADSPGTRWDFAFSREQSILIRPTKLFSALSRYRAFANLLSWERLP